MNSEHEWPWGRLLRFTRLGVNHVVLTGEKKTLCGLLVVNPRRITGEPLPPLFKYRICVNCRRVGQGTLMSRWHQVHFAHRSLKP